MREPAMEPQRMVDGATLVCFALPEEAAPFRRLVQETNRIHCLVTGIGKENARRLFKQWLEARPRAEVHPARVLTCGFAGGLHPELKPGEVLFETADPALAQSLKASGACPGTFLCSDRVLVSAAEKREAYLKTQADAVEMESAAIQAMCRDAGIPCATVRVISDTAGEDLPLDFNALSTPDKNLDFGRLLLAVGKAPWKIPELLALRKKTNHAAGQLALVLESVIAGHPAPAPGAGRASP